MESGTRSNSKKARNNRKARDSFGGPGSKSRKRRRRHIHALCRNVSPDTPLEKRRGLSFSRRTECPLYCLLPESGSQTDLPLLRALLVRLLAGAQLSSPLQCGRNSPSDAPRLLRSGKADRKKYIGQADAGNGIRIYFFSDGKKGTAVLFGPPAKIVERLKKAAGKIKLTDLYGNRVSGALPPGIELLYAETSENFNEFKRLLQN